MSYLALARKWRPRNFSQVVGQQHIVSALSHALDNGRVHHAFLLTGTRGVGKTTIARILAKCLNCEVNGVSAKPCGTCSCCIAVDEGRFIDLIEVDAASRTKVDDTRDLLDNVQYAPTIGQYKVYLIDEVHMLSGHSFNALLKTLEEPPAHVKFVLATTDPQKLPVTVLSRCLQFYLKILTIEQIETQMQSILTAESIEFEHSAVRLIARSAHGSMRDGLSLLDQSIAYGSGTIQHERVLKMLGLVDDQFIYNVLDALAAQDARSLLAITQQMAGKAVDFSKVLDELLDKLHSISLLQFVPDLDNEGVVDKAQLSNYVGQFKQEIIQLYYQIALMGKRDINLAPDMRCGMEMILLRMLAFTPLDTKHKLQPGEQSVETEKARSLRLNTDRVKVAESQATSTVGIKSASAPPLKATIEQKSQLGSEVISANSSGHEENDMSQPGCGFDAQPSMGDQLTVDNWSQLAGSLHVSGFAREILMNAVLKQFSNGLLELLVANSCAYLINEKRSKQLQSALSKRLGPLKLKIILTDTLEKTPAQIEKETVEQAHNEAHKVMLTNPDVQKIMNNLDATVIPGSIKTH